MKLKGIDGDPHKRWSMWFNSKQREEPYQVLTSFCQPSSLNPMGIVHGGALVTLADTVCGTAAFTTGHMCVTLDCSMQYLAPASGARITCTATPRKLGKTVLVYEAVLTDDTGRTVATGVYTFFAKGPAN